MPLPHHHSPLNHPHGPNTPRPPAIIAPWRSRSRDERTEATVELYRDGWFPMNDPDAGEVHWVQPNSRGIIPLESEKFVVPRSLRSVVRSSRFVVTTDQAFEDVIRSCASPAPGRESTWIDDGIIDLFHHMHQAGLAHSIEAWVPGDSGEPSRLVGGLYGLAIGTVFCGESMFSRPALGGSSASKVCLVHLVHHLRRRGFTLLDAQMTNDHLEQFGCYTMPREEYLERVAQSPIESPDWQPFDPSRTIVELTRSA